MRKTCCATMEKTFVFQTTKPTSSVRYACELKLYKVGVERFHDIQNTPPVDYSQYYNRRRQRLNLDWSFFLMIVERETLSYFKVLWPTMCNQWLWSVLQPKKNQKFVCDKNIFQHWWIDIPTISRPFCYFAYISGKCCPNNHCLVCRVLCFFYVSFRVVVHWSDTLKTWHQLLCHRDTLNATPFHHALWPV